MGIQNHMVVYTMSCYQKEYINMERKNLCYNSNTKCYKYYGGKGISVCIDWKNNYVAFKFWATLSGYQDSLTIDRIDNDGNYEPTNCQWLTKPENTRKAKKALDYMRLN